MKQKSVNSEEPGAKRRRGTFRRLFSYAAGVWPTLAALEICIVGSALLDLARPWIIGFQLFDLVIRKQDLSRLPFIILLLTGSFVGQQIFDFGADVLQEFTNQSLVNRVRCDLYAHALSLPVRFFDRGRTGDLLARISGDIDTVENFLETLTQNIGSELITLIGILTAMFAVSVRLTLCLLPTVAALACSVFFFRKPVKRFSRSVRNRVGEMSSLAEEAICGIRVVKAFCAEAFELDRFTGKCRELMTGRVRLKKLSAMYSSSVEFCVFAGTLIVVWFASPWVVTGKALTVGGLVAFFTYTTRLYSPVKALSKMNLSMQKIIAAGDRVFEVMDVPRESVIDASQIEHSLSMDNACDAGSSLSGDIRFEDVSFGYEPDAPVLKKFSLHIRPGELVAIVGPSGSGKTTIVNLLLRFYEPTSGRILVNGLPIECIPLLQLRRQIAVVPQETFLFSGSARENIGYGTSRISDEQIVEAAQAAYAHDFLVESPDGYLTEIGERGVQLSGGQRQRLAIARAVVRNPGIIVFDEATSHLDSESEQVIQAALEEMAGDRTILVIAHRFSTIRRADKIVVVENGRVVEIGSHEELLELNGRYRRVHSLQMQSPGAAV